jgi:hypothetical protein
MHLQISRENIMDNDIPGARLFECMEDFFFDNSSKRCVPECGKWTYTTHRDDRILTGFSKRCVPECGKWTYTTHRDDRILTGFSITGILLAILLSIIFVVGSGIKHKQMFRFPAIFLVYSAVTLLIYGFFNFATKFDRETVICSSRNLVETLDKGGTSFYCLFVGMTVIIAHIVFINNVFLQGHSLYMQEYRLFSGGFPIPQF